ncbi:MAG: polyketide cyclase [Alphaproteobacteria bacterium]|nr:polyketide cyclase [Alphaproteobacteria bacterium]
MLKFVAIVGLLLAVAVAVVLVLAANRPDVFQVARATTIKAPPDRIFPLINDFHKWGAWSPYEKKDPEMKRTYGGAGSGAGAVYAWAGDKNVGHGRMEIVDSAPPSKIVLKLDFVKPFEAHNTVEFTLNPEGDSTVVRWAMHGPAPYMAKIVHLFFDMDSMVGKDFEAGLANLKTAAESK